MIPYEDARSIVLNRIRPLPPERVELTQAAGMVLARDVSSDMDLPPFDKSAMDGFALRASDVEQVPAELTIVEDIPAGKAPTVSIEAGQCARIMTGAPVPRGADAVVMVEDTELVSEECVHILKSVTKTNICVRGEDMQEGALALATGHSIRPPEIGLLASVGASEVWVHRLPRVAVLATGDELVGITEIPELGEIRDANTYSLLAACRRAGFPAKSLGVARDQKEELQAAIGKGLESDVLLVSAGVSVGDYDFVKDILPALELEVHFDRVAMKPGMPTVFATRGERIVFGIPGNPVSTIVVFKILVEPALRKLAGHTRLGPEETRATLVSSITKRRNRRTYLPVRLDDGKTGLCARPLAYHGSADLAALTRADGWAIIPRGNDALPEGTEVKVIRLEC